MKVMIAVTHLLGTGHLARALVLARAFMASGHATTLVRERLRGCELLMVESNHDERMLQEGPYPWHLKQRVSGRLGHLSNPEAAALRDALAGQSADP